MTPSEYLWNKLDEQTLAEDSDELKELRERRKEVEDYLRERFGSSPTIRYGGSKSKGTMIKDAYDLDVISYFPRDDDEVGGTLETIFENVKSALSKNYVVVPKTSAIRLQSRNYQDFHVDVVPGRYVDDKKADAFLHRTSGDKQRLKTNLDVHIDHVKNSGVVPAIRLMKLWRVRGGLLIKHFALELLIISVLEGRKSFALDAQLRYLWKTLRDDVDSIRVEDPANPTGNDLSELLSDHVRRELSNSASQTLHTIENEGWEAVFGELAVTKEAKKAAVLKATRAVIEPTRPWYSG